MFELLTASATQASNPEAPLTSGEMLIGLIVIGGVLAGSWRVFEKAGQPGWASIVPIYHFVVLLRIAKCPTWWIVFYFVPVANVVAWLIVNFNIAWRFGKDVGYGVGLTLLPFVFFPILGFGRARYRPDRGPLFSSR